MKHVVLIGNPNTGKSTLFSALTGSRTKAANFPGVTVEAKIGDLNLDGQISQLVDLPGSYSLAARSPDERVAIDTLLGRHKAVGTPDAVVVVVDASSLDRNLYLATQVMELKLPVVLALTMVDVAESRDIHVDASKLSGELGVPVIPVNAPKGKGLDELKTAIGHALESEARPLNLDYPSEFDQAVTETEKLIAGLDLSTSPTRVDALRLLVDQQGPFLDECVAVGGDDFTTKLDAIRATLPDATTPSLLEAQTRYSRIAQWTALCRKTGDTKTRTLTDKIDSVLTHRVFGSLVFVIVMGLVFNSIYSWSGPMMDLVEFTFGTIGDWVGGFMAEGMLKSLVADGVIAGVGGVLVFLPQILILFLFIAVLEDLGYMSRAAFLMDRLMSRFGLSGKSFIPLLSSFACAIPGVMGARVIEDRNTRMTTMFLAPFMSCSARLPVYTLFIGAFVPEHTFFGFIEQQGLVLFAMYWVGVAAAIPTALVLKKGILKSKVTPFLLELPSYKIPRIKSVLRTLWEKGGSFVKRAGTIILATSVLVWALGYFPQDDSIDQKFNQELESTEAQYSETVVSFNPDEDTDSTLHQIVNAYSAHDDAIATAEEEAENEAALSDATTEADDELKETLESLKSNADYETSLASYESWQELEESRTDIENRRAGAHLENSWLGRAGKVVEPAVEPLGWDWRIGMAAIASFPAREVIIATMGVVFNLGADQDEESQDLVSTLKAAKKPDGTPLFNLPVALSVMVFFALCCQCAATLAVMGRETKSWRWPIASFVYMTTLAYFGAMITYQVASALGG